MRHCSSDCLTADRRSGCAGCYRSRPLCFSSSSRSRCGRPSRRTLGRRSFAGQRPICLAPALARRRKLPIRGKEMENRARGRPREAIRPVREIRRGTEAHPLAGAPRVMTAIPHPPLPRQSPWHRARIEKNWRAMFSPSDGRRTSSPVDPPRDHSSASSLAPGFPQPIFFSACRDTAARFAAIAVWN